MRSNGTIRYCATCGRCVQYICDMMLGDEVPIYVDDPRYQQYEGKETDDNSQSTKW